MGKKCPTHRLNTRNSIGKIMCPVVTILFTAIYFVIVYHVGRWLGQPDIWLGIAIGSSYFFARHWYRTLVATDISTTNNEEDSLDRILRATMTVDEYAERKMTRKRFLDRRAGKLTESSVNAVKENNSD